MDQTSEISTNTSNTHLTKVRVQIDSSLQGHLKALTKLTRGIERANHHSQLLQTAIETKRPPRGLIPKVSPKIPDTPGSFTIEWENSLQEAGLVLTKKLQDYWSNRSTRLEAEYSPIYNNLKSISTQEQWNTIEDIHTTNIQRSSTGIEKKETKANQPTTINQYQQSHQKKHHKSQVQEAKAPNHKFEFTYTNQTSDNTLNKGLKLHPHSKKGSPS